MVTLGVSALVIAFVFALLYAIVNLVSSGPSEFVRELTRLSDSFYAEVRPGERLTPGTFSKFANENFMYIMYHDLKRLHYMMFDLEGKLLKRTDMDYMSESDASLRPGESAPDHTEKRDR